MRKYEDNEINAYISDAVTGVGKVNMPEHAIASALIAIAMMMSNDRVKGDNDVEKQTDKIS